MATIMAEIKRKHKPILSIKGIPGVKYLNPNERGMAITTPAKAAFVDVLFQNNPKTNIARTPGLIKPVNS
jgi:hypothetical protein